MKQIIGRIISAKMPKTAIVKVDSLWQHPLYQKRVKRSKKYAVHTELDVQVGQTVKIVEIKPISKTKRWKIIEVVKK